MRVAAIQFAPRLYDLTANRRRIAELAERAFCGGALLAVLPEMATSGYCLYDRADALQVAEPVPGPTTGLLREICRRHGTVAVLGLPEVDQMSGVLFNTLAVVGPQGLIGKYRKLHSYVSEPLWAMDGNLGPVVLDTPAGRIGLVDCMDVEYPELGRTLQLLGAELIAFAANWPSQPLPSPVWWAMARDLSLPLVAANRIGSERGVTFWGGSAVFAADGALAASLGPADEGVLLADVAPAAGRSAEVPAPEAYLPFSLSTHLFDPHESLGLYGRQQLPAGGRLELHAIPFRGDLAALPDSVAGRSGLVLLPESAFGMPGEALMFGEAELAELTGICRRAAIHIAAGVVERTAAGPRPALVLAGPQGLLARHVEVPGGDPTFATVGPLRVALAFGREILKPETSRLAALGAADVLLLADTGRALAPVGHPDKGAAGAPDHFFLPKVRAMLDDIFVLYASCEVPCAAIAPTFDSQGRLDARGVCATLDTGACLDGAPNPVRYKYHMQKRRPEAYQRLWQRRPDAPLPHADG